jgi:hypothetical protein
MKATGKEKAREEGLKIWVELIQGRKNIPGVHGIYLMAIGWEEVSTKSPNGPVFHPGPNWKRYPPLVLN